jgi:hypothetical protein
MAWKDLQELESEPGLTRRQLGSVRRLPESQNAMQPCFLWPHPPSHAMAGPIDLEIEISKEISKEIESESESEHLRSMPSDLAVLADAASSLSGLLHRCSQSVRL